LIKTVLLFLLPTLVLMANGPILKTGQTQSYDRTGNVVTDASIKDDGYYQTGIDHNYSRDNINNIVTDYVTGLQWQDDAAAASIQKPWVTQANYDAGNYYDTSGDTASGYCESLTLGSYTDWRLPSVKELQSITMQSKFSPVSDSVFQNIGYFIDSYLAYWSSTTFTSDPAYAWVVDFESGGTGYYTYKGKSNPYYAVRCVRGEQLLDNSHFTRANNIVTDNISGLKWQDSTTSGSTTWQSAITVCEGLVLDGYSDWRLPNVKELEMILNQSHAFPAIDSIFQNTVALKYWTSTTKVNVTNNAWYIDFGTAESASDHKNDYGYVRCVRGGQILANSAPSDISLSASSIEENQPSGTTVGTLSATDADAGDSHTFGLTCNTPGADDANFAITGTTLKTDTIFDHEATTEQYICIRVSDGNDTYDKNFTITITNDTLDDPKSEINIKGNGISIVSGDSTPSTLDGTDFGSVIVNSGSLEDTHFFTIENTGSDDLHIGEITTSDSTNFLPPPPGGDAVGTPAPYHFTIAPGESDTFHITFIPTTLGVHTATISIINSDDDENPYTLVIQGTGLPSPVEKDALIALYTSTNGDNWTNNTNWTVGYPCIDQWYGVFCYEGNVVSLSLSENNLTGPIPTEIGNLTNLLNLHLQSNKLTGNIPVEIGNLTNLSQLLLSSNQLTGTIPSEIGNLVNVTDLRLDYNQLTGSIPIEIGNMTSLQYIYFSSNQLTGSIPHEIGNLTNLKGLSLNSNLLTGTIPSEIGNLTNLQWLQLHSNQLTGTIPSELGYLTSLSTLMLDSNQLEGTIPTQLWNLTNLSWLSLNSNKLTGTISPDMGYLTKLTWLDLSSNHLTGDIPLEITNLSNISGQLNLDTNCELFSDDQQVIDFINVTVTHNSGYGYIVDTNGNCLIEKKNPFLMVPILHYLFF